MNTSTLMKKRLNITFTLVLGAFVALGLSACAEGQNGGGASDSTMTNADSTMTGGQNGMQRGQNGMRQDSVSLQNTTQMFQQGLMSMGMQKAQQSVQGWQRKLKNVQAQGQAKQAISGITDGLGQLDSALQGSGQPDGQQVRQAFQQINQSMSTLMQNAQSLNLKSQQQQRLSQLQQALKQAPQQLMSGGGEGM